MIRWLLSIWDKLSSLGEEHCETPQQLKNARIINQLLIFFVLQSWNVVAFVIGVAVYLVATEGEEKYIDYFLPYMGSPLLLTVLLLGCYYLRGRTGKMLYGSFAFAFGVIFVSGYSAFIGPAGGYHYYLFVLLPLPFFAIARDQKLQLFSGLLTVVVAIFANFWWMQDYAALYPVPPLIESISRYTIAIWTVLAIMACCYYLWIETSRTEELLVQERQRADELLLNILPPKVADELKRTGRAEPTDVESASVLLTDFAGFTLVADNMEAAELVEELDRCFGYFDTVVKRYNLEKMKTIGDSFMAVGGVPEENHTHSFDCILAALEIQSFMQQMKEIKAAQDLPYWELRLGIHTGPLIAGVVGAKKFAYDIWGDAVDAAEAMEVAGATGKINISSATFDQVQHLFACEPHGNGASQMYYVEGVKKKYSVDGRGEVPNDKFKAIYEKIKQGARLVAKKA